MQLLTKTIFISDLHLDADHSSTVDKFLLLMRVISSDKEIDSLYILGDFFEAWIGDDKNEFYASLNSAFLACHAAGKKIYFQTGNRDFMLNEKFALDYKLKILPDEYVVKLHGKNVLLLHGDTLCTKDINYLRMRKIFRIRLLQNIFLSLPLMWRRKFAVKARQKSRKYTQSVRREILDAEPAEVQRLMDNYDTEYLIHGHTHRPCIHENIVKQKKYQRIVLGAWHDKASVLIWDSLGRKNLIEF